VVNGIIQLRRLTYNRGGKIKRRTSVERSVRGDKAENAETLSQTGQRGESYKKWEGYCVSQSKPSVSGFTDLH